MKRHRWLAPLGVVGAAVLCGWLTAVPAEGQTQTAAASTYTGKTPWGDPDLQGLWTTWDDTPLEAAHSDPAIAAKEAEDSGRNREVGEDANDLGRNKVFVYNGQEYTYRGLGGGMGREHNSPVSPRRPSLVVDPPNGRIPLLPGKSQRPTERELFDDYLNHGAWARCITMGVPGRLLFGRPRNGYNKAYEIFQAPGYVVVYHEMIHEVRVIPVDGRPHLNPDITQWLGSSRGRWEGRTLVVETKHFNGKGEGQPTSVPATEALHVIERFTRIDEKTLQYEATLTDPNVYGRPWTGKQFHNLDPEYTIFEYACHEGNWRYMETTLSRGRLIDAEEAAKKAK